MDESSVHFQKIESFKKRYDCKFNFNPYIQLTILPPFSIELKNNDAYKKFISELFEIIDAHFLGNKEIGQIEFNGINFSTGKKSILSLTPKIIDDFIYVKESIYEFLKDEGATFKKGTERSKLLMPIGRFEFETQLESALEKAKIEFSSPFVLNATKFILFEKSNYSWATKDHIYNLNSDNESNFLNQLWVN